MKLTITWGSFQSRLKPSAWRPLNHKITVLYLHGCPRVSQSRVKYKSRIWLNGHNLEAMTRWSRRCTISSVLFPSVAMLFFCNHLLIRYTKSLGWCTTAEMPFCGALTEPIVKYLCVGYTHASTQNSDRNWGYSNCLLFQVAIKFVAKVSVREFKEVSDQEAEVKLCSLTSLSKRSFS